jgi:hypothetical protein
VNRDRHLESGRLNQTNTTLGQEDKPRRNEENEEGEENTYGLSYSSFSSFLRGLSQSFVAPI